MFRYIALLPTQHGFSDRRVAQFIEGATARPWDGWRVAHSREGALVLCTGGSPGFLTVYPLADNRGVVLGTLFRKATVDHRARESIAFGAQETRVIVQSRGAHLVGKYWGRYVAIFSGEDSEEFNVLRDPSCQLTCFLTKWSSVWVLFSHIEDCVEHIPVTFTINQHHLVAHLMSNLKPTRETGLAQVQDIPGGELQVLSDGAVYRKTVWHPGSFCLPGKLEDEEGAAAALRTSVQLSVDAWASCHESVVHCLSGGLDSSIVACCLARAPSRPNVTCVNIYLSPTERDRPMQFEGISARYAAKLHRVSSHGDERQFARLVAKLCGFPVVEQERHVMNYDLSKVWDSPRAVLPSRFVQYLDQDAVEARVVRSANASAVFNGQGGDEVFNTTFQSVGIIDYAYNHRLGRAFLRELHNACSISREPLWLVLWEVLKYGLLRTRKADYFDFLKVPHLLNDEMAAQVTTEDIAHPWESFSRGLPPGKLFHLRGISGSGLYYHFAFAREREAESVFPLSSQPVIETCLSIPVYTLLTRGVSRGLARRAFSDYLPAQVKNRTTKGYTFGFVEQLIQSNIDFFRESLLDGCLVQEGILDRRKTESYLTPGKPFRGVPATHILVYLGAEAWLRQWRPGIGARIAA